MTERGAFRLVVVVAIVFVAVVILFSLRFPAKSPAQRYRACVDNGGAWVQVAQDEWTCAVRR